MDFRSINTQPSTRITTLKELCPGLSSSAAVSARPAAAVFGLGGVRSKRVLRLVRLHTTALRKIDAIRVGVVDDLNVDPR